MNALVVKTSLAAIACALAFPVAAQGNVVPAGVAVAPAGTNVCKWKAELAPDRVRSPVQMDIHAAYRIFGFKSDGTVGYRVRGAFPYAAFLSYTIYDGPLLHSALIDHDMSADPGSTNPFLVGALVHAPERNYTITVLPDGVAADSSMPNPIHTPLPKHRGELATVALVQRIYLPEPEEDRFGGTEAPVIEAFEIADPTVPAACPGDEASGIADDFGNVAADFSQSPLPSGGRIAFYRPPVSDVPYADGDGFQDKHDCTGYLMATVLPDRLAVIHLPQVPAFFENTAIGEATTFLEPAGARYVSLGSHGATLMGEAENENVAGPEIKTLPDGSATFVAIPVSLPTAEWLAALAKADELGYNAMPLAEAGPLIVGPVDSPTINPFLIYRNKVAAPGFAGNIKNVACFQGTSFRHAPRQYAASPDNMGEYAPTGVECAVADFMSGSCGRDFADTHR
jgi:hypothetical protein